MASYTGRDAFLEDAGGRGQAEGGAAADGDDEAQAVVAGRHLDGFGGGGDRAGAIAGTDVDHAGQAAVDEDEVVRVRHADDSPVVVAVARDAVGGVGAVVDGHLGDLAQLGVVRRQGVVVRRDEFDEGLVALDGDHGRPLALAFELGLPRLAVLKGEVEHLEVGVVRLVGEVGLGDVAEAGDVEQHDVVGELLQREADEVVAGGRVLPGHDAREGVGLAGEAVRHLVGPPLPKAPLRGGGQRALSGRGRVARHGVQRHGDDAVLVLHGGAGGHGFGGGSVGGAAGQEGGDEQQGRGGLVHDRRPR
jgi:hypothetical protein